jgi:hypothetical protein
LIDEMGYKVEAGNLQARRRSLISVEAYEYDSDCRGAERDRYNQATLINLARRKPGLSCAGKSTLSGSAQPAALPADFHGVHNYGVYKG